MFWLLFHDLDVGKLFQTMEEVILTPQTNIDEKFLDLERFPDWSNLSEH